MQILTNKLWLMIAGIIILIMGIMGLPYWDIIQDAAEPLWHAALKIIVGLVLIIIAYLNEE